LVSARQAQISSLHSEELRRRTAHSHRADELVAVDDDRQRAGIREIAERYLACFRRTAGEHLVHRGLAGLAGVEHGPRLHEGCLDVDLPLPVHAVEIDRLAELIEHDDADAYAALDRLLDASLADRFGSRDIDLVLLHHALRGLATNEELVTVVGARGARKRHNGRRRQHSKFQIHR